MNHLFFALGLCHHAAADVAAARSRRFVQLYSSLWQSTRVFMCALRSSTAGKVRIPISANYYRSFAVKALSWCAPSDSPNRREKEKTKGTIQEVESRDVSSDPIDKFGVVAAMARNRVMGVNGQLPWNLPEDRKKFVDLTRNRILIMGRRTYEEQPTKSHISHAANNIVVSRTLDPSYDPHVEVVRSFPEALQLAKIRANDIQVEDSLKCWVAGGERIYNEALNHPAAQELHLTIVDVDVDVSKWTNEELNTKVAFFPAKYRWDRHFNQIERTTHETIDGEGNPIKYEQVLYRRKSLT